MSSAISEQRRRHGAGTWRGWAAAQSGGGVASDRLAPGAPVASKAFPKIRSWWALGAPIELMSPLSVLRVLFLVGSVMWPVAGLAWRRPDLPGWLLLCAGAATAGAWAALLSVRSIGVGWTRAMAGVWLGDVSLLVWSGHGTGIALGAVTLYVPGAVFVALFLDLGAVAAYEIAATAGAWAALALDLGPGMAGVVAAVAAVALVSTAFVTLLLNRSARHRESVDPDTGLPNGFGLAEQVADAMAGERAVVVAAVALEGIGEAREAMGYHVGTELLRRAVEDIGQVLPVRSVLGRVNADELVVVQEVTSAAGAPTTEPGWANGVAQTLAGTLCRAIDSGRYALEGVEMAVRPHVGLAIAPWDGGSVPELVRRASLSARRAVADGETEARWDGERGAMTPDDLALLSELGTAWGHGELWLAYQPQVEARSGRTVAVEALVRWRHPHYGELSPGRFVPLAERTGAVDRLTEWVLAEALDAQVRWRSEGFELGVAVNFSARTLSRPGLSAWVLGELAARDLPAACLTVEMTETAAANLARAREVLEPLREQGVRVSIDDFGTGYTSLAALRTLPLDELKIDLQFVQRSATSAADDAVVRTVSQLARRLGLVSVAEGVEGDGTRQRMTIAGYDVLQGYHFSKPLEETALVARQLDEAAPVGEGRP